MDLGTFKSNKVKLTLWILVPVLLVSGVGLSAYALRRQSEWQLSRTRQLAMLLPQLAGAKQRVGALMVEFRESGDGQLRTSDELISFLESAAGRTGFIIDTLKVDRRISPGNAGMPVLVADVKGTGGYLAIEGFIGDVTSQQHLLSAGSLRISQTGVPDETDICRADMVFELFLFDMSGLR